MSIPSPIVALVQRALQAPSGDNLQPWEVRLRDGGFDLRFLPDRARSLLDCGDAASRLACGAVLENLLLVGAAQGQRTTWSLNPEPADPQLWARVTFAPMEPRTSALAEALDRRCTNRARFDGSALSSELIAALGAHRERDTVLELISRPSEIKELAVLIGAAERVRAGVRQAHEDLQHSLRWTPEEAERTRDGLDVRTLGVTRGELAMLRFFAPWRRMRVLVALGGTWLQGRYARSLARTASAFAWIGVPSLEPAALVAAGQVMQRVWLSATSLGLEVSPFAALPLLGLIRDAHPSTLSAVDRARIDAAFVREHAVRSGRAGRCVMLLRIGRASRPTVRTLRRCPEQLFLPPTEP